MSRLCTWLHTQTKKLSREAPAAFLNLRSILSRLSAGLFQKFSKICLDGCQGRPGIIWGPENPRKTKRARVKVTPGQGQLRVAQPWRARKSVQHVLAGLVMNTGHPRAKFGWPAPTPANTHTRRHGCGYPVPTGAGPMGSRGFTNPLWVYTAGLTDKKDKKKIGRAHV